MKAETKGGQEFYIYTWAEWTVLGADTPAGTPEEPTTVWIDAATKLPVFWENQHSRAVYTFNLTPATLSLPERCRKLAESTAHYHQRIEAAKMPPLGEPVR
ncbi:MAG: hypothetical protein ACFUZC_15855 [Chthoniobacteraceae bacterium]